MLDTMSRITGQKIEKYEYVTKKKLLIVDHFRESLFITHAHVCVCDTVGHIHVLLYKNSDAQLLNIPNLTTKFHE